MNRDQTVRKAKLALLSMQRYSWDQGVTAHAFIDWGDEEIAVLLAREAAYRQEEDGRTAVIGPNRAVTDPCAPGESLVYAYERTGDRYFCDALDKLLDWALNRAPRTADGIVYHLDDEPQIRSDSAYMLPPFLAAAGYYKEAVDQLRGYWRYLYCKESQLLHHMWTGGKISRAAFWGGGVGWALAGVARVLQKLPGSYAAEREELAAMDKDLLQGALRCIRPDGLAYDVLDDPRTFVETNFTQMCAYTLFTGMADGWLEECYSQQAQRLRAAANAKVDRYGLVQDVCGSHHFAGPGVSPEGQAFYLLMEAAAARYEKKDNGKDAVPIIPA